MIFEAQKENLKLQVIVTTRNDAFYGRFQIQSEKGNLTKTFKSENESSNNEWSLIEILLFKATKELAKENYTSDGLTDVIWEKYFDSKQLKLNFV